MSGVIAKRIADRAAFLHRLRTTYVRLLATELGLSDLADVAEREVLELAALARELRERRGVPAPPYLP